MKKVLLPVIFFSATFIGVAQSAQWQNIFNGKDLAGWKQLDGNFGVIIGITEK